VLRAAVTNRLPLLSKDLVWWFGTVADQARPASFRARGLCFGREGGHYVGGRRSVGVEIRFLVPSQLFACFGLMRC
jgi:hypothetical protein